MLLEASEINGEYYYLLDSFNNFERKYPISKNFNDNLHGIFHKFIHKTNLTSHELLIKKLNKLQTPS